ncbi:MAG TPA: hypothetical protein VMW69_05510, partial [Spirochaetia bacterium]|nr:hypothetical protein [Spirochaetia bacterium]
LRRAPLTSARKIFTRRLSAHYSAAQGLITVSYRDADPSLARSILAYAILVLAGRVDGLSSERASAEADVLSQQARGAHLDFKSTQNRLVDYEVEHGIANASAQLNGELRNLLSLQAALLSTQQRILSLTAYNTPPGDPRLTQARRDKEVLLETLAKYRSGADPSSMIFIPVDQIPRRQIEYGVLSVETNADRQLFSTLKKMYETKRLEAVGMATTLQIVEAPETPELPDGPSMAVISVVLILAAFVLSSLMAVGISGRGRSKLTHRLLPVSTRTGPTTEELPPEA